MNRLIRSVLMSGTLLAGVACGGGGPADPNDDNNDNNNGNQTGNRTMSATWNGVAFSPNLLTSAYLSGNVSVSAADGTRNFHLAAINVNSTGTYQVGPGNPNSAIAEWVDNIGSYSSGFTGGGGTVTFTVLQLGRVAGSLNVTMRNTATGKSDSIVLVGTFDIPFP